MSQRSKLVTPGVPQRLHLLTPERCRQRLLSLTVIGPFSQRRPRRLRRGNQGSSLRYCIGTTLADFGAARVALAFRHDPKQTNPSMSFKRPLYLTLTMTLPFARPLFTYAMASLVDANGKT